MGDFYQTGVISTLHRFTSNNLDRMEAELKRFSRATPMALILPCLYSELEGPAMPRILEELKRSSTSGRSSSAWTGPTRINSGRRGSSSPRSPWRSGSSGTTAPR
jgi:hypothetical protein